jgi:hypothetical protein
MTAPRPKSVTFETTVAASGNNTGIVVPGEVIDQLAAGKRPPVVVNVNGHEYRNTVAVMGGKVSSGSSRPPDAHPEATDHPRHQSYRSASPPLATEYF